MCHHRESTHRKWKIMKPALLSELKEKRRLHLVHLQASNPELTRAFYYRTTLDKLVISFICEGLHSQYLNNLPSRPWLTGAFENSRSLHVRKAITAKLKKSGDCVNNNRLLESEAEKLHQGHCSLDWWSAALACKRLRGSHTFDVLASTLDYIHSQSHIHDKNNYRQRV